MNKCIKFVHWIPKSKFLVYDGVVLTIFITYVAFFLTIENICTKQTVDFYYIYKKYTFIDVQKVFFWEKLLQNFHCEKN